MTRRRWRTVAAVVLTVALALVLLLRTERASAWACDELKSRLPEATGAQVQFAHCHVDALQASVSLEGLSLTLPPPQQVEVKAEEASVSLRGLFFGGVALHEVKVSRPQIQVVLVDTPAAASATTCPLDGLKRLRIETLIIDDANADLTLATGARVQLRSLSATASLMKAGADLEGTLRSAQLTVPEQAPFSLGGTRFEAHLDTPTRRLEVSRVTSSVEGASVSVTGAIEKLCDTPVFDLQAQTYVPMQWLVQRGWVHEASGQVAARLQVSGRADAPTLQAELTASQVKLDGFEPGDLSVRASLAGRTVHLDEVVARLPTGQVRAEGTLELTDGLPVSLKLETKDAPFGLIMQRAGISGSWVDFTASLKSTLTGHLTPRPSLKGPVDFKAAGFTLASRGWNAPKTHGRMILEFSQAQGTFALEVGDDAVSFDRVSLSVGREGHTHLTGAVKLFYDQHRGFDVRVSADAVDLSDFGHISGLPWSGLGSATVTVLGGDELLVDGRLALRDFKFSGYTLGVMQGPVHYTGDTLSFPSLVAQKGQTQYFGDVSLIFDDAGLYTRGTLQMPDGRIEDVIDILADLSPSMQNVQGPMTGKIEALAAIDAPASAFAGVIVMRLREAEYYERRLGSANGVVRFEGGESMILEPLNFEGPLGRFSVDGTWRFAGPLDYRMSLENGSLAELMDPKGHRQWPLGGQVSMHSVVSGTTDLILTKGDFGVERVTWRGADLGPTALTLDLKGRELEVNGALLRGVTMTSHTSCRNDWPFTSTLHVQSLDMKPFLPDSARDVAATLSGQLKLSGPMRNLDAVRADVVLDAVKIARGDISLANTEPVSLLYDAGATTVRSLSLKGPTTQITAEGTWGPRLADLRTSGSVDLKLVESLLPALERPSGHIDFTAALSGDVKKPQIAGSADARDIRTGVKGYDLQLKSGSAHLDFSESRVLLQELQGFLNDGRIRGHGDVRLDGLSMQKAEVQVDLENVTMQVQDEVPATFSGNLLWATRNDINQVSGSLDIEKLKYARPMSLDSLLTSAKNSGLASDEKPVETMRFDVDIGLGNDVRIENNLARARLLGKLKLAGTNVKPILIGAIEAGEGAQAYFRNNTYAINRGTLQFNGLWPTFDVSAQTQVREYLVNVKAFGRFEDPKISLSAEPALSEADIVSLLTLGVTSRERFASESGAGLAAEALLSASGLDKQMQRFLQNNVVLKDQQVRLTTTFNEATGTAEPSVSWESKVVLDNLKVGVTHPVVGRGTKAQAEYRFNQGVSARAQWDDQNQNTTIGNPGVDLRFRFEWE